MRHATSGQDKSRIFRTKATWRDANLVRRGSFKQEYEFQSLFSDRHGTDGERFGKTVISLRALSGNTSASGCLSFCANRFSLLASVLVI